MNFIPSTPLFRSSGVTSQFMTSVTSTTHRHLFNKSVKHTTNNRSRLFPIPSNHDVKMRVATDGDAVLVHYSGYLDDGTMFDTSYKRNEPLNFIIGGGDVIRGFDDAVRGLSPGETRKTKIEADRAYGNRSEDLVFSVNRNAFPTGLPMEIGSRLPLTNGMNATIIQVSDDKIILDANHHLAGKTLTFEMELIAFAEIILSPPKQGLQRAIFGLGCFWGAELAYQRLPGVVSTKVGYSQGKTENPTYKQVCSGSTGHAEVVAVDYDPSVISYEQLLDLFWERLGKSALTLNQVGNDVGTQYRSGIYYMNEDQKIQAEKSKQKANEQFGKETVVEIVNHEDVPFYLAESYHQRYLEKGGQSAEKGATETIRCYG